MKWDNNFLENLHGYEWEQVKSLPARRSGPRRTAPAWTPCRDAHDPSKKHAPMMLTTDLSLRMDPDYAQIAKRFMENPEELADAFARAWYKLTHRDMGPVARYLGSEVPAERSCGRIPCPKSTMS